MFNMLTIRSKKVLLKFINCFLFVFFNSDFRKLLSLISAKINNNTDINKGIILFDNFESFQNTCFRLIYLPIFSFFFKSKLKYFNLNYSPIYKKLYDSINAEKIVVYLNRDQKKEKEILFENIIKRSKTKKDVLNITVDNVNIGLDIYESYLIRFHQASIFCVNKNKNLYKIINISLTNYIFWKDFIKKNNIEAVLLSHRCYIETNILNRLAIKNSIPVFTLSGDGFGINRWNTLKLQLFDYYPKIFRELNNKERRKGLNFAKKRLQKRLDGKIGVDMNYSTKSAFSKNKTLDNNLLFDKNKINILICTHCFYDNPHAYGKIFFCDFYEWLLFLAKISNQTDYNWFIKPHPDYLPGTLENIKKVVPYFKNIELINPLTSFNQLKDKIDKIITVYGSVGHELPLLGFEVINCADQNPHKAYKFCFTPRNLLSLKNKLLNLKKKNYLVNKNKIYEFYYMHYHFFKYNLINNYFFNKNKVFSLKKFINLLKEKNYINKNVRSRILKFLKLKEIMTVNSRILSILKKVSYYQ
jgi:hypothetical protein